MKKHLLYLLFTVLSVASYAQTGSLSQSVYRSRVLDSTTVTTPTGWGLLYFNTQRTPATWVFSNDNGTTWNALGSGTGTGNQRPIDSGVLSDPELTFDTFWKKYTLDVDEDIALTLAASGNVGDSYVTIMASGNGVNALTFPTDWVMLGDTYDNNAVQEITLRYTGDYVIGTIVNIADTVPPVLVEATVINGDASQLNLNFNEPVTITSTGWSISASGGAVTISSVISSGSASPVFQMSRVITNDETVTVSYDPGTGSTIDLSGNELGTVTSFAVDNQVTIIFSESFSSSLDAGKWDETNPSDGVTISVTSGRLRFAANPASAVASANTNHVDTDQSFNQTLRVFRATLFCNSDADNQSAFLRLWNASEAYATGRYIQISKTAAATPKAILRIWNGASLIYDFTSTVDFNSTAFKIKIEASNDISFYSWNGSTWAQVGTTQNFDMGGALKLGFGANSSGSDSGSPNSEFDTVYITDTDFTGIIPD